MISLIIFAAKYLVALPIIVAIGYALVSRRRREFLTYAVLVLVVSYAFASIAGQLYYNPRPFAVLGVAPLVAHADDNGFPSEHALLAGMLAGAVTPFNPALGAFLWLIAVLIGIGRVFALVHHPIDIIASLLITGVISYLLWRFRYLYQSPKPTSTKSGA